MFNRKYISTLIILLSSVIGLYAQYKIKFQSDNYKNDTLIVGYYYGDRQLVKDSLFRSQDGSFLFEGKDTLHNGVYLLLTKPDNNIFQFLVNDEKNFSIKFNANDLQDVKSTGSVENKLFLEFIDFISTQRKVAEKLRSRISEADSVKTLDVTKEKKELETINGLVMKYQDDLIMKNPKSLTAFLIQSGKDVEIPEPLNSDNTENGKRDKYYYYRGHYFDNVNLKNKALVFNGVIFGKTNDYFNKMLPQIPDTLIKEIDIFLEKIKGNSEAEKFYLSHLLNKYGNKEYIGTDAIFVHLIDNYFKKGRAPWAEADKMESLYKYADEWRPILIGKVIPNFGTYTQDSTFVRVHSIKAPYTLVIFWAPDCGHCTKSMPFLVDWEAKYRSMGVKVISVCTYQGEKSKGCWAAIDEKKMTNFINTYDYYQEYRRLIHFSETPKLFLLDQNKKILLKDFSAEKLDEIFIEVMKSKEELK